MNPGKIQRWLLPFTSHGERIFKTGPVMAGESRVMMSPYSAHQMYYNSAADLATNYLLDRSVFLANCNLLDGVPKVDGFFSLYLRPIDRVLSLFDTNAEARLAGLEDVMAVSQTIAPGKVFDWVRRPSYIPWMTAGQAPVFASEEATLQALANLAIDFHTSIYLPLEAQSSITAQRQEAARVVAQQFNSARIVLEVETPGPAMVSISQAWYHDWKASVDGKAVPLWRANEAFQAVEAPAGRHQITLVYKDLAFRWGACLSVLGLMVCGWAGVGLAQARSAGRPPWPRRPQHSVVRVGWYGQGFFRGVPDWSLLGNGTCFIVGALQTSAIRSLPWAICEH